MSNEPHWTKVKGILGYLKSTASVKLEFEKQAESELSGYNDADWANDTNERKLCKEYILLKNSEGISWRSQR